MKRKLYPILVLAVLLSSGAMALPVAKATYTIPNPRFGSLKSIIDTLNIFGISGGTAPEVTINLTADEALGPYILGSCVLNVSGVPIVINGGGKTITAHSGTGSLDAIFAIQGTDNVTISNFKFVESSANTTATTMMEWGVAGLKLNDCGSIDGVQTLNVTDCEITLNKTNATAAGGTAPAGSAGVFIGNNTALSRTALAGPPSVDGSNRFFYIARNKITNVNHGIWCAGLRTDATGAVSGDAFLTLESNNISNFTHNGISISHFNNDVVQTNMINNMNDGGAAPTANTIFGVRYVNDPAWQTNATWVCSKNNIDLTINTTGTTYAAVGIMSQIYGTGATDINTDTIKLTSSGTSAFLAGVFCQNQDGTLTIAKNYIKDFTTQTTNTQSVMGIYAGGYAIWPGLGLGNTYSATYYLYFPTNCTVTENLIDNFSICSGATAVSPANRCAGVLWDNFTANSLTLSKNTLSNINIINSSVRYIGFGSIYNFTDGTAKIRTTTFTENTITNISTSGALNATPILLVQPLGSYPNGQTFNSSKNKISNITSDYGLTALYMSDYCVAYNLDKDTISNINSLNWHTYGLWNASTNTSSTSTVLYSTKTISVKNCSFTGMKSSSISGGALSIGFQLQPGNVVGYQLGELNMSNNVFNNFTTADAGGAAAAVNLQTSPANSNISNNMISDIAAASSTATYCSSFGILLQNTGSNNIFYNTINMATASATGYGASGIAYNPAGSNTIQNNILRVDVKAGTTNNVVAMRALAGSASIAPSLAAFTASSNIYHTPQGPNNYLYGEGTTNASLVNGYHTAGLTPNTARNIVNDKYFNSDCDKSLYHKFMQTATPNREKNTYTEDNLTGSAGIYAPATGSVSYAESKATDVSVVSDFKSDPRYFGSSDIGAWEFDGKQIPDMTITIASSTGFDTACPYNLPTLTATIPSYFNGRVKYQWYRGTTILTGSTGPSITVSPVSGNYYITVFDTATGCTDTSAEYRMTIVPPPPAIITYYDSLTFCETSAIVIQANKGFKYTYRWFFNSAEMVGETDDHLVVDKTGEYSLEVNTPLGCATNSTPIRVKVYPLPKPTVFTDGPQRLKTQKYYTYQWYRNNVKIDDTDAIGQTIYIQSKWGDGAYSVEVTDSNGCTAKSDVYLYSILSLDETTAGTIKVYPNPATDRLYIESSLPGIQAQLTDLAGRVIIGTTNSKQLDMSTLAEGMYLLTLTDKEGKQVSVQKVNKVK